MTGPLIDIIGVGSKCATEDLTAAKDFLTAQGFGPRAAKDFFGDHFLYLNTDEKRLENLIHALYAEDSTLLWALRGGCGTSRLLPKLLSLSPPPLKKTVIGFSDITALHLFLTQQWGWKTLHGATLNTMTKGRLDPSITQTMVDLAKHTPVDITFSLRPLNSFGQSLTHLEAPITGGNLALLERSLATPWQVQTEGKIIFFEDINEEPYRVAEKLDHCRHAGLFEGVKAVLFGAFSHEDPQKENPDLLMAVLKDCASKLSCPVFNGMPVGHVAQNQPVYLGHPALLYAHHGQLSYKQTIHR